MKQVTILEILGLTQDEYWQRYIKRYMNWCIGRALKEFDGAVNMQDLQKLMANAAINNYYTQQFRELEDQALSVLRPQFLAVTLDSARRIYEGIMIELFNHYPKPLIDAARKLKIVNDLNLN